MFIDVVKVLLMRYWSFEFTALLWPTPARRAELRRRKAHGARMKRIQDNIKKVRKAVHALWAAHIFEEKTEGKHRVGNGSNGNASRARVGVSHQTVVVG